MKPTMPLLLLCLFVMPGKSTADEPAVAPAPAPLEDRVGFPKDYDTLFVVLRTVLRDEGAKIVTIYGNPAAASITTKSQRPYPNGSVIVMETASTKKDDDGNPIKDARDTVQKDKVLGMHVMRREKDFGKDYADKRSGEWEFVEYRADGSYITPPNKSASCAECHIKAGPAKDFVFNGRFTE